MGDLDCSNLGVDQVLGGQPKRPEADLLDIGVALGAINARILDPPRRSGGQAPSRVMGNRQRLVRLGRERDEGNAGASKRARMRLRGLHVPERDRSRAL